jgi:hypothetical protein
MNEKTKKQIETNGSRRSVDHANQIMSLKDENIQNEPAGEFTAQRAHKAKAKPRVK